MGAKGKKVEQLAMEGPSDGTLFRRSMPHGTGGFWSKQRCLLVDRRHPSWDSYRTLHGRDPDMASAGLAHLLLSEMEETPLSDLRRLFETTLSHLETSP